MPPRGRTAAFLRRASVGLLVPAALLPWALGNDEAASAYFVKKTVFDPRVRFAFIAGLEGTGHHAIQQVLTGGDFRGLVVAHDTLTELIYADGRGLPHGISVLGEEDHDGAEEKRKAQRRAGGRGQKTRPGSATSGGDKLRERKRRFQALLADVAAAEGQGGAKRLVMLNALRSNGSSGMISWPNFMGPHKAIHHVDLYDIAAAAEGAGVDLRVLVLMRPAQALLTSIVHHRGWSSGAYTAAYLADNAAVLGMQLRTIDPGFFVCAELHDLAEAATWKRDIIPFLHPALPLAEVARTTGTMRSRPKLQGSARARYQHGLFGEEEPDVHSNWEFVRHLDRYLQQVNATCRAKSKPP